MAERTMTMVELNECRMRNLFNGLAHVCDHGVRVNPVVFVNVLAVSTRRARAPSRRACPVDVEAGRKLAEGAAFHGDQARVHEEGGVHDSAHVAESDMLLAAAQKMLSMSSTKRRVFDSMVPGALRSSSISFAH